MANNKRPKLTKDEHLHSLTDEQVYRIHHGMDPATGEAIRGVTHVDGVAQTGNDECSCAHCVSFTNDDPEILDDAREAFATAAQDKGKKGSQRTSSTLLSSEA